MLTCKEITERVTDYLERELSWWEWCQFRLHLTMCVLCRRYVAQLRTTTEMLREVGRRTREAVPSDSLRHAFRAWRDEHSAS